MARTWGRHGPGSRKDPQAPRRPRSGRGAPSFAQVYDDHVWDVYGFFAYRLASRADAEDLTHQTFEQALRAWPRFDPQRSAPGTWLLAIARNVLIDHFRRERGRSRVPLVRDDGTMHEPPPLPGQGVDDRLGIDPTLARALDGLSEREREVLALRFGADRTGPQIAELLGLTLANVQQISSRALRALRLALDGTDLAPRAERVPGPTRPGRDPT